MNISRVPVLRSLRFSQAVEQEFIDAVRWLERKGVSGITGSLTAAGGAVAVSGKVWC